jgi:hypothetical protein
MSLFENDMLSDDYLKTICFLLFVELLK